jgi:prepilin-type N-terminal cleavage/methylation domain-containing protein/prepilin-type processing-associated H-X9-DG protein
MRKLGLTMIEMLVVIAVLALLTAVLAPSMMAAKNQARTVHCSSNLRQLSLGFLVYQHENDTFPYGFCDAQLGQGIPLGGYAGSPMFDKQGLWWFNYLQSAIELNLEPGSVLWCPARKCNRSGSRKNVLCGNYGVNRSICRDAQGLENGAFGGEPLRPGQVRAPSVTFLLGDSGYSLLSWLAAVNSEEPVFENPHRLDSFYAPGLTLNANRRELLNTPDAIKGRHPHQTLNVGFVDGHNETLSSDFLTIKRSAVEKCNPPSLWVP